MWGSGRRVASGAAFFILMLMQAPESQPYLVVVSSCFHCAALSAAYSQLNVVRNEFLLLEFATFKTIFNIYVYLP